MNNLVKIIKELTAYPNEEEWFEFKENWYQPDEIGEYISSISNAAVLKGREFGYLIWGVTNDTHDIVGTTFDYQQDVKNEPLEHYLARSISPDLSFEFYETTVDGKRVVVLVIPAAKTVPTGYKGMRYLRVGSSKVNLAKYPAREAALFRVLNFGLPTIENTESQYQELTFEQLFVYYGIKGITLKKSTFKKNLGLLTPDGKYNLLAQLLSDDPHIPIRFSLFKGKTKASPMYSVREFGNMCLLMALDRVLDYGEVLNVPQADERNRKTTRDEVMLFDKEAYREAVINAFVHNQWTTGNEPMFTVYEDRIEILSRGTIPQGQTIDGFFAGESIPVNQKLSEILLQLHISEKSGRGVPRIIGAYGREAFDFRQNSIVVTIPFNHLDMGNYMGNYIGNHIGNSPSEIPHEDAGKHEVINDNDVAEKIVSFCAEAKNVHELLEYLGYKDRKTLRKYLKPLIEQGRIARTIPGNPKSRQQKYVSIK